MKYYWELNTSQTLKTTSLVNTLLQAVFDVHWSTKKRHDTQIGWQLAHSNAGESRILTTDKGYDSPITR